MDLTSQPEQAPGQEPDRDTGHDPDARGDALPTEPARAGVGVHVDPEAPASGSGGLVGKSRRLAPRLASTAGGRWTARAASLLAAGLRDPQAMLPVAFILAFVVRVAWLDWPHGSLIFDEAYYVQAARALLGWPIPAGAHYAGSPAGLDPNTEHPPLGKLIMAASMLVFGDNGFGWRIPSVVAGMVALYAMYRIVVAAGETLWFAAGVVFVLALENLTLVHGRIATLDILFLAPILVGSWMALRGRWAAAGVAMGIGLLVKLPAMYGIGAVGLLYLLERGPEWVRARRLRWGDLQPMVTFVASSVAVWLVGLAALDARFSSYTNPFQHIDHMLQYGANLAGPVAQTQHCPGAESLPWQWLFNDCQISYLRVDVTVTAGKTVLSSVPSINFQGAMNPILVGLIPLGMLFAAWYAWREGHRLARWAVTWAAANYLPFLLLAVVSRRVMYIYYMLPAVPAIAVAFVLLLTRSGMPRPVRWGLVVAYVAGFLAYYPFRQIP